MNTDTIETLQAEIDKIKEAKLNFIKDQDFEYVAMLRDKEKILLAKIEELKSRNK